MTDSALCVSYYGWNLFIATSYHGFMHALLGPIGQCVSKSTNIVLAQAKAWRVTV